MDGELMRRVGYRKSGRPDEEELVNKEWLVTNGLGGYASGTLAGVITRGFHGYLVAALPAPLGRIMMLNDLVEQVELPNVSPVRLGGEERVNTPFKVDAGEYLQEFALEDASPVWIYQFGETVLEKRVLMVHRQNTVHVNYRLRSGPDVKMTLRPCINFRPHEAPVSTPLVGNYALTVIEDAFEVFSRANIPPLRLMLYGRDKSLTMDRAFYQEVVYRTEESRGYAAHGDLWSPGYFSVLLTRNDPVTLVASAESWESIRALSPEFAQSAETNRRKKLLNRAAQIPIGSEAAELVLAADQFIIVPEGRGVDSMRARASGDDVRSIIAGYPWFTDWGRDTMITLEGLTLTTGRYTEAGYILRTFGHYVRRGLIPNMFPEGHSEGLYHTADATLWFFHAIARYVHISGDHLLLEDLLPQLELIVEWHLKGTDFGIQVDPVDSLLRQGAPDYQLTWMDAKVDDWVVTPRRGKAVEINALWYNALCHLADWLRQAGKEQKAEEIERHASKCRESFRRRFWYEKGGYLYDVVDGEQEDLSLRPNQLLAISLDYPILDEEKWPAVVQSVHRELLTPFGLRSLAPSDKSFKPKYNGNLRDRDAAYHQGTVWPWLLGPFIDAWLKVHPGDFLGVEDFLKSFSGHLGESAVGSIAEIFDAEPPYIPRGCIAQAWSVSEVLRSFAKAGALKVVRESAQVV